VSAQEPLSFASPPLILASASPRRRQLLRDAGLTFEAVVSGVDETVEPGTYDPRDPWGSGRDLVRILARRKADSVAAALRKSDILSRGGRLAIHDAARPADRVLGADTLVVTEDGDLMGQPIDRDEARRMIAILSGRTHFVHTGLALVHGARAWEAVDSARVRFRSLTPEEIDAYVATGEGDDKAGAYAYQGIGRGLIESVDGDEETVIGLPTREVARLLAIAAEESEAAQ
jgi:septum formation protein